MRSSGAPFSLRREGIAPKVDLGLVGLKIKMDENDDAFNGLLDNLGANHQSAQFSRRRH
jgi:hypothetical protein